MGQPVGAAGVVLAATQLHVPEALAPGSWSGALVDRLREASDREAEAGLRESIDTGGLVVTRS